MGGFQAPEQTAFIECGGQYLNGYLSDTALSGESMEQGFRHDRVRVFFKINVELHIKASDAVLKNYILIADGIEIPALATTTFL